MYQADALDNIESLSVDYLQLPSGDYHYHVPEKCQALDMAAPFPVGVTSATQYGHSLKAHVLSLSQYQLLFYYRIQNHFEQYLLSS
ncbi:hypothetical protein EYS14_11665 [Alteromonadaceae bacterium M269]|nr:hypothetical protein EYS14_11665 [Alteromonadaceae bacterium M269]